MATHPLLQIEHKVLLCASGAEVTTSCQTCDSCWKLAYLISVGGHTARVAAPPFSSELATSGLWALSQGYIWYFMIVNIFLAMVLLLQSDQSTLATLLWTFKWNYVMFLFPNHLQSDIGSPSVVKATQNGLVVELFDGVDNPCCPQAAGITDRWNWFFKNRLKFISD